MKINLPNHPPPPMAGSLPFSSRRRPSGIESRRILQVATSLMKRWQHGIVSAALGAVFTLTPGCRVSVDKPETIKSVPFTDAEKTAAIKDLRAFLDHIDNGREDSWDDVAQILKASTNRFAWRAMLGGLNAAFGKNRARGNAQIACTDRLSGAPAGRYFVVDIASKFERGNVTERVVLALEGDRWRVAGYFRKKTFVLNGVQNAH